MRRALLLIGSIMLTACANGVMPQESFRPSESGATISTGTSGIVGTNEVTPDNADSLEVPAASTGTTVTIKVEGDAIRFSATEKEVPVLTEYLDYDCEYCHEYAFSLRPWIMQTYIATGKITLVRRFVPLSPRGTLFAAAALCAAEQNAFDGMDSYLLTHASADQAAILKEVVTLKLPLAAFKKCLVRTVAAPTFSDGTTVTRVPAFEIGTERWLGMETKTGFTQRIEAGMKK